MGIPTADAAWLKTMYSVIGRNERQDGGVVGEGLDHSLGHVKLYCCASGDLVAVFVVVLTAGAVDHRRVSGTGNEFAQRWDVVIFVIIDRRYFELSILFQNVISSAERVCWTYKRAT